MDNEPRVLTERRGHVFVMTLNRAAKRNAFDEKMFRALCEAYTELESDPELRCGLLLGDGPHFTAGADLGDVAFKIMDGVQLLDPALVNPWNTGGQERETPVVAGVHGRCFTLGIELLLAADVRIADETARFAQTEVKGGILPFGGATSRFVGAAGWGNAMRWMLTGDDFGAEEALRMGLLQEVTPAGSHRARALELAERIAAQAPLGVRATMRSAALAVRRGADACHAELASEIQKLLVTEDARIGMTAFLSRTEPEFLGR
ncbi:crotonase/enoyl-CoA hydratase family protein [Amycolatopsis sp. NPDC059090]|uniref:crotonase/enoyl-CoA hydratase family protein n=1 Tax=unclassified Amycolatopsis TaxID=2618356 RepID=UPI00366CAE87